MTDSLTREQIERYGTRTMESGSTGEYYTVFDKREDGEWIRYADYTVLRQQLAEAQRERDTAYEQLERSGKALGDLDKQLAQAQARIEGLEIQYQIRPPRGTIGT